MLGLIICHVSIIHFFLGSTESFLIYTVASHNVIGWSNSIPSYMALLYLCNFHSIHKETIFIKTVDTWVMYKVVPAKKTSEILTKIPMV